jgi:hypothetical protein
MCHIRCRCGSVRRQQCDAHTGHCQTPLSWLSCVFLQDHRWGAHARSIMDQSMWKPPRGGGHDDKAHPPIHPVKHTAGGHGRLGMSSYTSGHVAQVLLEASKTSHCLMGNIPANVVLVYTVQVSPTGLQRSCGCMSSSYAPSWRAAARMQWGRCPAVFAQPATRFLDACWHRVSD